MRLVGFLAAPLAALALVALAAGGTPDHWASAAPLVGLRAPDTGAGAAIPIAEDEETTHRELVARVQVLLALFGYDPGSTDGVAGPQTRAAIRAFQQDNGMKPDGLITLPLLRRLDAKVAGEAPARTEVQDAPDLGVSRAAIQALFEGPKFGFVFTESSPAGDLPRVIGRAPNRLANLELIGTPDALHEVSILLGMPKDHPDLVAQNAVYMLSLVRAIMPDWPQATEWVNENIERAMTDRQASIVWKNKKITLLGIPDVGALAVSIESIR